MSESPVPQGRRKLLKSIALGGGAVAVGKTLPESWTKPVIDSVMLPAHGQASIINYYGTVTGGGDEIYLCIETDGSSCSIQALQAEQSEYFYEGSGSIGAEVTLTQPTECDDFTASVTVDSVGTKATGSLSIIDEDDEVELGPLNFNIPQAACGFDVGDAVCSD